MGRMDPAVLSLRCPRRFEKSLVLVWMSAGVRRNVQRTTVVRGAVFCPLAIVAKKMDQRAACARRVHSNRGADSFTMASANARGLDRFPVVAGASLLSSCDTSCLIKPRGSPEFSGAPRL